MSLFQHEDLIITFYILHFCNIYLSKFLNHQSILVEMISVTELIIHLSNIQLAILEIIFIDHLLGDKCYVKHFMQISTFHPSSNFMRSHHVWRFIDEETGFSKFKELSSGHKPCN